MSERTLPKPSGKFEWAQAPWGAALRCGPLADVAPHLFSTRDLALEGPGDEEAAGWTALANALGVGLDALVRLRQVHGADVHVAGNGVGCNFPAGHEAGKLHPTPFAAAADVVISGDRSCALSVRVADCVPILLADSASGAVAAVHAGWKGTAAGAVMAAVAALTHEFEAEPARIVAAVGPSIGPCCYEVGPDLAGHFRSHPEASRWFSADARPKLDLWTATRDQLVRAGVPAGAIHVAHLCTRDHPQLFHSYRRDGARAGRLVAAIRSARGTTP